MNHNETLAIKLSSSKVQFLIQTPSEINICMYIYVCGVYDYAICLAYIIQIRNYAYSRTYINIGEDMFTDEKIDRYIVYLYIYIYLCTGDFTKKVPAATCVQKG